MGLASKLAAAQANQAAGTSPYGAPPSVGPGQQGSYGQPHYQTPQQPAYGQAGGQQQSSFGQTPGAQPYGSPYGASQGQHGVGQQPYGQKPQYPGQPQQGAAPGQYGAPSAGPYGQPGQLQSSYGQPGQQQAYGQSSYGQAQQQVPSYGQPQQQQQYGGGGYGQSAGYGGAAQQQQQQYGGAAPAGGPSAEVIANILQAAVVDQKLQAFYPPGSLQQIAQNVARSGALQRISTDWSIPLEIAIDLVRLALFDVILYLDDSGSMAFEENGSRIDDLKLIVNKVATAASLFDQDGIQVRFMNSNIEGNNINSEQAVANMFNSVKFSGLTPLGTALNQKILEPLLLGPARQNRLQKPVLVIAVTDGAPGGEDRNTFARVVVNASRELSRTRYGPDALSIQISQVGNDMQARSFLGELDRDREVGGLIDCTSSYEMEADEFAKTNKGAELTPSLWLVKLCLGAVSSEYDSKDE
ncbi:hypothetical protein ACM66B_006810 [Microbotryomycetes sp. NB124-2]